MRWTAGAAAVVGESGAVFQLAEREVGLQGGEVGAVDVERGHLVAAGRQFMTGPLRACLPDPVRALGGLLAEDVRDPRVRDDVVPRALAGLVEQPHRVRDRPLQQRREGRLDIAPVLGERRLNGLPDQVRGPGLLLERALGRAPGALGGVRSGFGGRTGGLRAGGLRTGNLRTGRLRAGGGLGAAVGRIQVLGETRHPVRGRCSAQHTHLGSDEGLHLVPGLVLGFVLALALALVPGFVLVLRGRRFRCLLVGNLAASPSSRYAYFARISSDGSRPPSHAPTVPGLTPSARATWALESLACSRSSRRTSGGGSSACGPTSASSASMASKSLTGALPSRRLKCHGARQCHGRPM